MISQFVGYVQIPEFPRMDSKQKSCGNVRIWRKRAAVRRKNHSNLNKIFGMKLLVPAGQVWYRHNSSKVGPWPSLGSFLINNHRGPNRISEIPYQKSLSKWSKIETKNLLFPLFTSKLHPLLTQGSGASSKFILVCDLTEVFFIAWKRRLMLPLLPVCLLLPRHPARLPLTHLPWPRLAQVSPFVFCVSVVGSFQLVNGGL